MAADQQRPIWLAFILCAGVAYWFYVSLDVDPIHSWDSLLINQSSGEKRKPIELINLIKVINYTREYIDATNAEERLYDLKYQLDLENPFVTEQNYAYTEDKLVSGWPVANQTQCGAQLDWILARLAEHANYTFLRGQLGFELTSLMDSFGRPEANTYAGVISWLGSYERCLRTSLDGGRIKMRYCEARMQPKWWPSNDVAPMIPPTRIRLGVCLPETCDTMSLEHHRPAIERLAKFQLPELYKSGLDMVDLFCLPDERSPIRQLPLSGRIFLAVVGSWLVLVVAGTIVYECKTGQKKTRKKTASISSMNHHNQTKTAKNIFETSAPPEEGSQTAWALVEALSLRCSLKAFTANTFHVQYNLGHRVRVDLGGMDFFKVLMAMVVVLCHSFFLANIYARNLVYRVEGNMDLMTRSLLSMTRGVDTFYVFYGVLATYNLMRKFTTSQLANPIVWLGINLGIFMRVAPMFMLVYWYSRSVSPYTGAGPWWDYGLNELTLKGRCSHESWLKSIPYFGQWGDLPAPPCNVPAWFIVNHVQLALLLPLITYIICRLPHLALRLCLVGFLSVTSGFSLGVRMYTQTTVNSEGFTLYGGFLIALMEKFGSIGYTSALGRLSSVSIGCLAGYLLRQYELGAIERWPNWLRSKLTIFAVIAAHLLVSFLPLISYWSYLHTGQLATMNQVSAGYIVLHLLWPTLNALLILPLTANTYCHTVVIRFFSHSFWHSANRLGFCIFLVHWETITWTITAHEQAAPNGFLSELLSIWALAMLQTIALSFLVHLLFEAPLACLTMLVLRPLLGGAKRPADKNQPESYNTTRNSTGDSRNGNCGTGESAETANQKENHLVRLDQQ